MEDSEIIKALECCSNCESCDYETTDCPLGKEMECRSLLAKSALDLINRLQEKNSNLTSDLTSLKNDLTSLKNDLTSLKNDLTSLKNDLTSLKNDLTSAKAENERLKAIVDSFTDIGKLYSEIKSEAYKEFAEKLKEIDGKDNHTFDDCASILVSEEYKKGRYEKTNEIWETIDNLLKELVGEGDTSLNNKNKI